MASLDETPPTTGPLSVLFVCLGNICRSTMAEGVFRSVLSSHPAANYIIDPPAIDSAGTGAYHLSSPPDPRTLDVLAAHSITSYTHAARKIRQQDFEEFDYIFAMDAENLEDLQFARQKVARLRAKKSVRQAQDRSRDPVNAKGTSQPVSVPKHLRNVRIGKAEDGLAHVMLFGAFGGRDPDEEVQDPYYGGRGGFETAYEQVSRFSKGFLEWLDQATASE